MDILAVDRTGSSVVEITPKSLIHYTQHEPVSTWKRNHIFGTSQNLLRTTVGSPTPLTS